MTPTKIEAIQGGVAKRAIADTGRGIIYASHDGLVVVDGVNARLDESQIFFTRSDWRDRYGSHLSSMKLAAHDGFLIGFFDNVDGFILRLDEAGGTLTKHTGRYYASFVLPQTDTSYMAIGNSVYQFAGGAAGSFTWNSGEYVAPTPINFSCGYFDGAGSITLTVFADGVLKHTEALTNIKQFRLPAGFTARKWDFKLSGTGVARALHISDSMMELASV